MFPRQRSFPLLVWTLLVLLSAQTAFADIAGDMQSFMNKIGGTQSNVTKPGIYNAQQAGSFVGGSLNTRVQQNSDPAVYFRAPKINAGCEGIDINLGAFSAISGQEVIEKLQAIGQSAAMYAFSLAIAYFLPTSYGTLMDSNAISNVMNAINMDSCNAGRALVNSSMDQFASKAASECTKSGIDGGYTSDRVAGIKKCRDNEQAAKKSNSDPKDPLNGVTSFNLVYEILRSAEYLDQDIRETMMSMIDGMVYDNGNVNPLPSTVDLRDFLGDNLTSSTGTISIKINKCDEPNFCLAPVPTQIQWTPFKAQVAQRMQSMYDQLKSGSPMRDQDLELINSTPFPLWRLLKDIHKVEGGQTTAVASYIDKYSIVLAMDILSEQITKVERAVRQGALISKLPNDSVARVEDRIKTIREEFRAILRHPNFPNTSDVYQAMDRLEKEMARRTYAISPTLIQLQRSQGQ